MKSYGVEKYFKHHHIKGILFTVYKMSYHCPLCGKPTEYKEELHGLCEECYAKIHSSRITGEPRVSITVCNICGRIKFGNSWIRLSVENFKKILSSAVKKLKLFKKAKFEIVISDLSKDLLMQGIEEGELQIPIRLVSNDVPIKDINITTNFTKTICPLCMKKRTGSYFEYVIHVRFSRKKSKNYVTEVQRIIDNVLRFADPSTFVDVKKIAKGLDIRVSDRRTGRIIAQRIKMRFLAESYEYLERRYDATLKKLITIRKVTLEI